MRYKIFLVFFLLNMILVGCVNNLDSYNLDVILDNAFKYKGTWRVENYYSISEDIYSYTEDLVGKEVQIEKDSINIFNSIVANVRYKLKVVDKNYVISYEDNITAENFMGTKEKLDIISAIDNNMTLCEFVILDDNNIVMIYRSKIIYLKKISNDTNFNINNGNIVSDSPMSENNNDSSVGVMIGIKKPRTLDENGKYTEDEYRTIWISYKDDDINAVYEKENIIFPRMNGIWSINAKYSEENNKHFDYFEVTTLEGKVASNSEYNKERSIYKSINFIGNDYIALESYSGESFINEYHDYKIVPVDNINSNEGLSIEQIFNKEIKELVNKDFKSAYENITDEDKNNYKNIVDYTNITMTRNDGKWILKGKISSIKENEEGKDFNISIEPNKKLINFNALLIPWKILKGEVPFLLDAYTSPNGEIAIVRYKNYLTVYRIEDGHLQGSPLIRIPLQTNEEIIMSEWCTSGYVDEWQKAFNDGKNIYIEEE